MNSFQSRRMRVAAPIALPAGFTALLIIGAIAAGTHGTVDGLWVVILTAIVVISGSFLAEPRAGLLLGAIGWLTVAGFSAAPYAQLRLTGPVAARGGVVLACCCAAGIGSGALVRKLAASYTLWIVDVPEPDWPDEELTGGLAASLAAQAAEAANAGPASTGPATTRLASAGLASAGLASTGPASTGAGRLRVAQWRARGWAHDLSGGIGWQRLLAGALLVAGLPLLTWALVTAQHQLSLADDLLLYLVAVVGVAVVGGFWPAVLAAVTSSLLLNWYFTRPVHTLTIADPQNLLALLLFITVAVTVSSVVHLAAHRAQQAARNRDEATRLLALAQTVLGGADTPTAVLDNLTSTYGGAATLVERSGGQWIRVASSGTHGGADPRRIRARPGLVLAVSGPTQASGRLLDGFAAQAAAALDRDRLRIQAAQAEALAEGNRMRTALLAAVSHDLRTPLASIKASVSTLRQTDVKWSPADEAALLATIEQGADRLDALIGNLLDASRLAAGSLRPFLRPTALDEVVPVALRGLDAGPAVVLAVPEGLPLVRTDPGLLERVLANLFTNALEFSPDGQPPVVTARAGDDDVVLTVTDHGPGVPAEFRPRMFEPFARRDARGTGVGLGLAVVRGFLDAMGGTVTATDTPGGGLTIEVRLPAATPAARTAVAADQ
jgi:signal transduction histidine kinase